MTTATRFRILIVDDLPIVREALQLRISSQDDLEWCGEAATQESAIALIAATQPHLVLVEISLRGGGGIELIKELKSRFPAVKSLVYSFYPETLYAERALRAGAWGYLSKFEPSGKLMESIRTVLSGKRFVSDIISQRLLAQSLGDQDVQKTLIEQLTDRELDIFRKIGEGNTTGSIARQLHLSRHTIDTYREKLKRKLHLKNGTELTREAIKWVLEKPSENP
jgi:DNA-binding NarL/FixJ family response regulator